MTPLDLGVGEFSLADKIQPYEHIQGRLAVLRRAYAVNPDVARDVISYAWPHAQNRPWTHEELYERLGIPAPQAEKVAFDPFIGIKAIWQHKGMLTPSASQRNREARDAYKRKKERQDREQAEKTAARFLKGAAAAFVNQYLPSLGAAFDAFEASRAQQEALDAARQRIAYPAMHFTQPMMASYAMGGGQEEPPPSHHHRRHHRRHHHG